MVRERQRQRELSGRDRDGRRGLRRVKTQSQVWLYSPRKMGYRTWFYAAFVCAYACCLFVGKTHPVRAPSLGHVGSRTHLGRSRVYNNFQQLHVAPFLCHGLDLGSDPSACIPRSTFCQMADVPLNDCQSYDWIREHRHPLKRKGWRATKL